MNSTAINSSFYITSSVIRSNSRVYYEVPNLWHNNENSKLFIHAESYLDRRQPDRKTVRATLNNCLTHELCRAPNRRGEPQVDNQDLMLHCWHIFMNIQIAR